MAYTKTNWEDTPSTATAISAANLNNIEDGVGDAHDHIAASTAVHGITNTANLVYTTDSRLSGVQTLNTQSGSSYTLVLADADPNTMLLLTNASSVSLIIPTNAAVAFPVGSVINLIQRGAGQVTVSPDSGVTLYSEGSRFKTKDQYAVATIVKLATNDWIMMGNVAA